VGAVVVSGDEVVGTGYHRRYGGRHAEIHALEAAGDRARGATLYVTLEPCLMCGGAAVNARLGRLVYGAADMAAGSCLSLYNVCDDPRLNHRVELTAGVEAEACGQLLKDFFAARR
jgi:tRNA(adenine34) deaminase